MTEDEIPTPHVGTTVYVVKDIEENEIVTSDVLEVHGYDDDNDEWQVDLILDGHRTTVWILCDFRGEWHIAD